MVKKRETETKVAERRDQTAASRRDFVKAGAAAGLGAAILSAPGKAQAQPAPADIRWDYEADVIVCGSGGTGIVAAKRAHDLGADVLVLEQNFDIGGKLSHNGGLSSFGGGEWVGAKLSWLIKRRFFTPRHRYVRSVASSASPWPS